MAGIASRSPKLMIPGSAAFQASGEINSKEPHFLAVPNVRDTLLVQGDLVGIGTIIGSECQRKENGVPRRHPQWKFEGI